MSEDRLSDAMLLSRTKEFVEGSMLSNASAITELREARPAAWSRLLGMLDSMEAAILRRAFEDMPQAPKKQGFYFLGMRDTIRSLRANLESLPEMAKAHLEGQAESPEDRLAIGSLFAGGEDLKS